MQVSIESGEGLERRMTVTLPAEQINNEVETRLKKIARTAKMDGFRPGKVPISIIRKRYAGSVRQEVFGEFIQSSYFNAINQENLRPAGEPQIEPVESEDDGRIEYTAVFEVLPEFELADLSVASITRPQAEITDQDVDNLIDKLRKQRVSWDQVERPAQEGDQIKISFKGTIEGEAFDGGSADDVLLVLGASSMIEGFEQGLIGATPESNHNLDLKFPDDYRASHLAGESVQFEVHVTEVSQPVMPELDVEFAKSFGVEEGGVDKLKSDVRENLNRELEQRIRGVVKNQVMDLLLDLNAIDIPGVMVDNEIEHMREQARQEVSNANQAGSLELPKEMFEDQAKRRVTLGLIIREIVAKNDIRIDPDRVRKAVETIANEYEDPDEVKQWYSADREQLAKVESIVMEDQVVDWIVEQVNIEEKSSSFEELTVT